MLDELGYDWIPIHDPAIRQPAQVAMQYGQYRMQFQAKDRADVVRRVPRRTLQTGRRIVASWMSKTSNPFLTCGLTINSPCTG